MVTPDARILQSESLAYHFLYVSSDVETASPLRRNTVYFGMSIFRDRVSLWVLLDFFICQGTRNVSHDQDGIIRSNARVITASARGRKRSRLEDDSIRSEERRVGKEGRSRWA